MIFCWLTHCCFDCNIVYSRVNIQFDIGGLLWQHCLGLFLRLAKSIYKLATAVNSNLLPIKSSILHIFPLKFLSRPFVVQEFGRILSQIIISAAAHCLNMISTLSNNKLYLILIVRGHCSRLFLSKFRHKLIGARRFNLTIVEVRICQKVWLSTQAHCHLSDKRIVLLIMRIVVANRLLWLPQIVVLSCLDTLLKYTLWICCKRLRQLLLG